MRWAPKRFNDVLAVAVVVGMPIIWVRFTVPEVVLGATIAGWSLALQYYFRKKGLEVPTP